MRRSLIPLEYNRWIDVWLYNYCLLIWTLYCPRSTRQKLHFCCQFFCDCGSSLFLPNYCTYNNWGKCIQMQGSTCTTNTTAKKSASFVISKADLVCIVVYYCCFLLRMSLVFEWLRWHVICPLYSHKQICTHASIIVSAWILDMGGKWEGDGKQWRHRMSVLTE